MKKNHSTTEIFLVKETTLTRGDLCRPEETEASSRPSGSLEEACWDGLWEDWLGGAGAGGEKLFLWKIHVGSAFLCLELSQTPTSVSQSSSLNPHAFLPLRNKN